MIRNLLAVLILCAAASGSVTVHAVLTDGTGTVSKTAFLRFQLENCGANIPSARVPGKAAIQTNFDLRPNQVDGSILYTTLFGNDEIQCGGVFSTYWFVTVMKDQTHPLRDGLSYVLLSGTTFDPAVTPVMSVQQPAPAPPPLCCVSPLQGGSPGGNPGGGPVTFQLPCPTNVVVGANGYSTGNGGFNCDPFFIDDGVGNWTSQSGRTVGPVNGFLGLIGGSASPGTQVKYKLGVNEFRWLAPASVGTPYYLVPPPTRGTPGQVIGKVSESNDGNGDPVVITQWQNSASSNGAEFQTNGVDNANCVAGACPLLNNQSGLGVNVTNPSGGNDQYSLDGASQIATPTAPTLTTNGSAGGTSITYDVVGCENPSCTRHTAASATTTIATANATLTSSNSVNLAAYADTLYGPRCYNIYRTAAGGTPSTTGLIAACVGKRFTDTGLAGDGSTAPVTNNTILELNMASLPGCNIPPMGLIGPDAPPCAPTAFDTEAQETSGVPADVNNTFWTWGNQGGATASFSSGTIVLNTDTTNAFEYLTHYLALPATPYTFEVWVAANTVGVANSNGNGCFLGLKESGTGKIHDVDIVGIQGASSTAAGGGWAWVSRNSTSNTPGGSLIFQAYNNNTGYIKIQVTSGSPGNVLDSVSSTGDGVNFLQFKTQATTTPFTTAPNQLILGGLGGGGGSTTCTFDFLRRTQ